VIGRTLSHYLIEQRLGAGGMGTVYLARDLALGRPAAVKVVTDVLDDSLRQRLLREADASARLQHPAIATFYESGEADDVAFIAMEYVRGRTLRERLGGGPLPVNEVLAIGAALLEALNHAHAAGILHRDIKPENVMLADTGAPKLLDFGLARRAREPLGAQPR
jgi:serine/threonine protein kinase